MIFAVDPSPIKVRKFQGGEEQWPAYQLSRMGFNKLSKIVKRKRPKASSPSLGRALRDAQIGHFQNIINQLIVGGGKFLDTLPGYDLA